jgi:hypothetical protein
VCCFGALAGVETLAVPEAQAIIIRDDVPDSEYVVADADYPAVVTLFPPDDCAGTLIHASYLLTVAHCAVDLSNGDTLDVNAVSHAIADITLHPMWQDGDNDDIAVVRFEDPVVGVDPVPIYRGSDELGAEVMLLGRGTTATGLEGEPGGSSDGQLRRATNVVSSVDEHLLEVVFERPGEAGVTDLEGVGASGDSGGPVLLEVDGTLYLAGLNAFGDAPDGTAIGQYGSWDYQTRVSRHADWIDGVLEEHGSSTGEDGSTSTDAGSGGSTSTSVDGTGNDSADGSMTPGTTPSQDGCTCTHGTASGPWVLLALASRRRRRAARTI